MYDYIMSLHNSLRLCMTMYEYSMMPCADTEKAKKFLLAELLGLMISAKKYVILDME